MQPACAALQLGGCWPGRAGTERRRRLRRASRVAFSTRARTPCRTMLQPRPSCPLRLPCRAVITHLRLSLRPPVCQSCGPFLAACEHSSADFTTCASCMSGRPGLGFACEYIARTAACGKGEPNQELMQSDVPRSWHLIAKSIPPQHTPYNCNINLLFCISRRNIHGRYYAGFNGQSSLRHADHSHDPACF